MLRRMQVRIDEVRQSFTIVRAVHRSCRQRPASCRAAAAAARTAARWPRWKAGAARSCTGFARRRAIAWSAARSRTRPLNNWPALVEAVQGNIVAGFSGDQQELQSLLLGDGPLDHVQDSQKNLDVGLATVNVSGRPGAALARTSAAAPLSISPHWSDARAAAGALPHGGAGPPRHGEYTPGDRRLRPVHVLRRVQRSRQRRRRH